MKFTPSKFSESSGSGSGSSHGYTHSESFAKLKATKESIKGNLTTYQYLSVMDNLLYRAIGILVEHTRFLDNYLAQILAWATQHPKRKISGVERPKLGALITLFFLIEDPTKRLRVIRQMKLDRTILLEALRNWTRLTEPYIFAPSPDIELACRRTLITDIQDLALTYHTVTFWYAETLAYKNKILEKYTRLCLTTAQRDYVDLGHQVDLEDMVQIYLMTASKAIDKCDADRGVLTNHISNWLMSAKNVAVATLDKSKITLGSKQADGAGENNTPSSKLKTYRQQFQSHMELDDDTGASGGSGSGSGSVSTATTDAALSAFREQESQQAVEAMSVLIQRVSRAFDPSGLGRLSLGIGQWLNVEERQQLQALALP